MNAFPDRHCDQAAFVSLADRVDHPPRILVVDDDGSIRHLAVKVLGGAGYRVDIAEDGGAG